MVNPRVDGYTKTPKQRKETRKTAKRQPTKIQLKEY